MSDPLRILREIDSAATDRGVVKIVGVENAIMVSVGRDGIGVLIRRGSETAAIVLSAEDARHVAGLLTAAAGAPATPAQPDAVA